MPCVDVFSISFQACAELPSIWERNGSRVSAMTQTLSHRGPDDSGVWLSQQASMAFGQRRLAIIDLSPMGHQPTGPTGDYTIAFNAEIYNFRELRTELRDAEFRFREIWAGKQVWTDDEHLV